MYRIYDIKIHGGEINMNGCCGEGRSFLTREEKIEMLKEYKDSLEKEAQGVFERIKDLERAK